MKTSLKTFMTVCGMATLTFFSMSNASAQIPTTDVANIAARAIQFEQQIAKTVEELETMKSQLDQAKQQYAAMTGSRGMGELLGNQDYSNVPTNWQDTLNMMNSGNGKYSNISAQAKKILKSMDSIDPSVFGQVDSAYGELSGDTASQAASYQAVQGQQYNDTAKRFDDLKQLVAKIDQAPDQKAILDLNARIGAEQVMLQNEQLKMQALAQLRESQHDVQQVEMNKLRAEQGAKPWVTMGDQH